MSAIGRVPPHGERRNPHAYGQIAWSAIAWTTVSGAQRVLDTANRPYPTHNGLIHHAEIGFRLEHTAALIIPASVTADATILQI